MEILNETRYQPAFLAGRVHFPGHSLTVIVKGTWDLLPSGELRPAEEPLYPTGDEFYPGDDEGTGSPRYESDFAPFKPRADLLLVGSCHPPGGEAVESCRVTFRVGAKGKSLRVWGERRWRGPFGGPSEPEPFREREIRYESAFGGRGSRRNPVGKGRREVKAQTGERFRPLPEIEDPAQAVRSRWSRPPPAGFGPLGRGWKDRSSRRGTYRRSWARKRWPAFPEDFDWAYFNAACDGLQVEGYLRGDEELFLENLYPAVAEYRARLPGERPRCFLELDAARRKPRRELHEVSLALDTLWVDAEAGRLVLVWRGIAEVSSDDAPELKRVFIAREAIDERISREEYRERFFGALSRGEEEPEEPEEEGEEGTSREKAGVEDPEGTATGAGSAPPGSEEEEEEDRELEEALAALARLRPPEPETPPHPGEEEGGAEARIRKELGLADLEEEEEGEEDLAGSETEPWTRERVEEASRSGTSLEGADLRGLDLSGLVLAGAVLSGALLDGARLEAADLSGAQLQGARLEKADLAGALLKGADLAGADLAGARLGGAQLVGADLAGVRLAGAKLTGADFSESRLERADLEAAELEGARLVAANLCGARLGGARGSGASFADADLTDADLTGADLAGADLTGAMLEGAVLRAVRLDRLEARSALFAGADLQEASLEAAQLAGADFSRSDLRGACLREANLAEASVEGASGEGVDMRGADLTELRASEGADFSGGLFSGTKARESIWEGAKLAGTDFSYAHLPGADFAGADLEAADLHAAGLREARFVRACLRGATLVSADLFEGSFEKADLREADLSGSNLYGVEFLDADVAGATLAGANLAKTKLRRRRGSR